MNTTIVIYGSSTGTCEVLAEKIASKLGCEALNVQNLSADMVAANKNLILGTSTWGAGELQDDWYDGLKVLQGADLCGKTILTWIRRKPQIIKFMKNWLRRAKDSEVFFHNGLHGLYGFLSLGGSCHSDCSASGHRRLLRRKIRIIRAIRCKNISEI